MSQSLKIFPYKNNGQIDVKDNRLSNVAEPTNDTDAATKGYVDTALGGASDASALKTFALVADNQADLTYPTGASAEYTCVKVNSETTTGFGLSGLGDGANNWIETMYARNGKVYAGGYFTTIDGVSASKIAVWDIATETWSSLGANFSAGIAKIVVDSNDNVYLTTDTSQFYKYVASTSTWSQVTLPFSMSISDANVIAIDSNNLVYMSLTSSFGGSRYLYSYDGTTFTSVANLNGMVPSVYSYSPNVIAINSVGTIYIGGSFGIRKLNGSTWEEIGISNSSNVRIIQFDANNHLYVGINQDNMQYYDGSAWTTIGNGTQGYNIVSYQMVLDVDGNVLVIGNNGYSIYKWTVSTQSWSTYYYDVTEPDSYYTMVYVNGDIYLNGSLSTFNYIAKLGTVTSTTDKMVTLNAPTDYSFVDINDNSYAPTSVTFYAVGNYFKVLYSEDDDTYYTIANTL